jgi:DNA-binding MarR family transcriptional regulator
MRDHVDPIRDHVDPIRDHVDPIRDHVAPIRDHVDDLTDQWAAERPELDTGPLRLGARIVRLERFLARRIRADLEEVGLNEGEVNVLAALRRAGPPYELTPTELYQGLLLSSGAMTNRIDRLETAGYVQRIPDEEDRRRTRVALTEAGRETIDRAMDRHLEGLDQLFAALPVADRAALEDLLRRLLSHLEADEPR